ncbi:hypothetical protein [Sellimonas intestinalis]
MPSVDDIMLVFAVTIIIIITDNVAEEMKILKSVSIDHHGKRVTVRKRR